MNVNDLIKNYNLLPHPEGGFYRETYRSEFSTAIFYLLTRGNKSKLHRIKSDEIWHFYGGDSITIVELLTENESYKETRLSKENVQYTVPANIWFGAYLSEDSFYALTGCTVAPAFHFKDFELADRETLLKQFPLASSIIEKLT